MGTTLLKAACAIAFIAPLLVFLIRLLPNAVAECRRSRAPALSAVAAVAAFGAFVFLRPHNDTFSGLDCSAMREMALAFSAGRPLSGPDPVLARVPEGLRTAFWYRTGAGTRPTRDLVFQLEGGSPSNTVPFFTPFLPLAAAGSGAPLRFPAMLATLWFAILLAACVGRGGLAGIAVAAAFLLATPWPCWFLRGFYAEGAGTILATSALVSAMASRMRSPAIFATAGFALAFAVSVHPIMAAISAPVAIALLPSATRRAQAAALVAGAAAGFAPGWLATRFVCHPYGDWTRPGTFAAILGNTPEHRALLAAAVVALLLGLTALCLLATPRGRSLAIRAYDWTGARRRFAFALAPAALSIAAVAACSIAPAPVRDFACARFGSIAKGAASIWNGIRIPCAILWLVAAWALARDTRQRAAFIAFAGISFAALPFIFIKGMEVPVGIWSQRRFLPVAIALATVFAPSLATACARLPDTAGKALACIGLLALGLVSPIRWPQAYFGVNEEGADAFRDDFMAAMDREGRPLAVFDYLPHAVPYMAPLEHPALGLSAKAPERWPEVAAWLADVASTGKVLVVSSYGTATLEEGFALEEIHAAEGRFATVVSPRDGYLPATAGDRSVRNRIMRVIPLAENGAPLFSQDKVFDGGPIGLRGRWGATRNGGAWTRQGSGIVGPVPEEGSVAIALDASWFPPAQSWTNQSLRIEAPWGGSAEVEIPAGRHAVEARIDVPAGHRCGPAGVYRFLVSSPYDPSSFGQRGYDPDLGVFLHRATIAPAHGDPATH